MKKKVMVVDDSRMMEHQIKRLLEDTDYEVAAYCENGEDAIARYEEVRPDIVTMDIIMPGIDGLEAAFSGDLPTLVIRGRDEPGVVSEVSTCLARNGANIATMQLYRDMRGGLAVMVIESDQAIGDAVVEELRALDGIVRVTYLDMTEV